jgi:hypothetical protein
MCYFQRELRAYQFATDQVGSMPLISRLRQGTHPNKKAQKQRNKYNQSSNVFFPSFFLREACFLQGTDM